MSLREVRLCTLLGAFRLHRFDPLLSDCLACKVRRRELFLLLSRQDQEFLRIWRLAL